MCFQAARVFLDVTLQDLRLANDEIGEWIHWNVIGSGTCSPCTDKDNGAGEDAREQPWSFGEACFCAEEINFDSALAGTGCDAVGKHGYVFAAFDALLEFQNAFCVA